MFITVKDDRDRKVALNTTRIESVTPYNGGLTRVYIGQRIIDIKMDYDELVRILVERTADE